MRLSYKTLSFSAWVFPLGVAVMIVLASLLVLIPRGQELMDKRREMQRAEDQLERLVAKRTYLESVNETELTDDLRTMIRVLPNEKPVFVFLSSLIGLVKEMEGLDVLSYDFSPGEVASDSAELAEVETAEVKQAGKLTSLDIEVEFEGTLPLILDLVDRLEGMAPLSDVYGFSLSGDFESRMVRDSQGFAREVENRRISMLLKIYYAEPPAEIAKPEVPIAELSQADVNFVRRMEEFKTYEGINVPVEYMLRQERQNPFTF